ncbi:hypothetical protein SANTM175S_00571 [Streptomyces antimycoticus]
MAGYAGYCCRSRFAAILLDIPKISMKPLDSDWSKVSPEPSSPGGSRRATLYDFNLATYDSGDTFDQSLSKGFIEIFGMSSKIAAKRDLQQ